MAVVVVVTFALEPHIVSAFPKETNPVVPFALAALATAVPLAFVYVLLFTRGTVVVEWTRKGAALPLTEIDAKVKPSTLRSEFYSVHVRRGESRGFGRLALAIGGRTGMYVRIRGIHSQLIPIIMSQDALVSAGEAAETPGFCVIHVALPAPTPAADTTWAMVGVQFLGRQKQDDRRSRLRHTVSGRNVLSKICGMLVKVDVRASTIVERWS